MKRFLTAFLFTFLLVACAPTVWYKDFTSQAEFDRDNKDCAFIANKAAASQYNALTQGWMYSEIFEQCMSVRGYHKAKGTST